MIIRPFYPFSYFYIKGYKIATYNYLVFHVFGSVEVFNT